MDYPGKNWISDTDEFSYAEKKYKEELEWLYEEIKEHQEVYVAELEGIELKN